MTKPSKAAAVAPAEVARVIEHSEEECAEKFAVSLMDVEDDIAHACLDFFSRNKHMVIVGASITPIVVRNPDTHRDEIAYRVTAIVKRMQLK